jgi:putative hydrolase of the HAD superfamily
MSDPTLILFDLDGVLVHYSRRDRANRLASLTGAEPDAVWNTLFESGLETESDLGRWMPDEYAREFARRLGRPVSLDDCVAGRARSMRVDEAVFARVRQLSRHCNCAILTNNGFFLRDHLSVICPGLMPVFADRVYCSAEFGVVKPDPEIFHRCLRKLGVAANRTMFVDDVAENVLGAIAAGIDAIHFTGLPALDGALAARGLLKELNDAT